MTFTHDQKALLAGLFSEGIQRAEEALRETMGQKGAVRQLLPSPQLIPLNQIYQTQNKYFRGAALCGAYIDLAGPFNGRTLMICDAAHGDPLVDRLFGRIFENDIPPEVYADMRPEAMCELGNLLLNACVFSFGKLFDCEIRTSIPQHIKEDPNSLFGIRKHQESEVQILFMPLAIVIEEREMRVAIFFELFSIPSLIIALEANLEKKIYERAAKMRSPDANLN